MSSTSVSSGVLSVGTGTLRTGHAFVNSLQLWGDGVNAAVLNIYDSTTASGKIVARLALPAATASAVQAIYTPKFAIRCENGLTYEITGTGASAIVNYDAA